MIIFQFFKKFYESFSQNIYIHLNHLKNLFIYLSKFDFPSVLMGRHFNEIVSKTIYLKCIVLFVVKQPLFAWCESSGKWSVSEFYLMQIKIRGHKFNLIFQPTEKQYDLQIFLVDFACHTKI